MMMSAAIIIATNNTGVSRGGRCFIKFIQVLFVV